MTVTFDDILAAQKRIAGQVDRTPVRYSRRLSQLTGAEVWVKFDNLHFTGSFKERGALNRLLQLTPDERRRGVVAASAGNHAQALAYHGARLGVPVTIVMPEGTPFVKADGTRAHGATVVIKGSTSPVRRRRRTGCATARASSSSRPSTMKASSRVRVSAGSSSWRTRPTSTC
jgi:threonine dehydratase